MNDRENINIREDPSLLDGPQRMFSGTRNVRKSERDMNDELMLARGGNNGMGDGEKTYNGYSETMFEDNNQASFKPNPNMQRQPECECGIPHDPSHQHSQHSQHSHAPHASHVSHAHPHFQERSFRGPPPPRQRFHSPQFQPMPGHIPHMPSISREPPRVQHHHSNFNGGYGSRDYCPHIPKCRYFMTFGYWCRLSREEQDVIRNIRM